MATIFMTSNNDPIVGTSGIDYIYGDNRDNIISGGAGRDYIYGKEGNDKLSGGPGDDIISDDGGSNIINGNEGVDKLNGGYGNDIITGGSGNDTLQDLYGDDILIGVNPFDPLPGVGEIDNISASNGANSTKLIVLGDANNIYYDDRLNTTEGVNDFASIQNFNSSIGGSSKDFAKVQLQGAASDYLLKPEGRGTGLYVDKPGNEPDELIAVFGQRFTGQALDLNSSYFQYVAKSTSGGTTPGTPTPSTSTPITPTPITPTPGISTSGAGAIGTKSQSLAIRVIDLTDYSNQELKANITTKGDAAYTNNIGFYAVTDAATGAIDIGNGQTLKPDQEGYAKAAIANAILNSLELGKNDSKSNLTIPGGGIYAPIVIAQGSLTDFANTNAANSGGANAIHAYFNYIGANPDKIDHFRLLGNNTFGVEDQFGGGDKDFNDLVVNFNINKAA